MPKKKKPERIEIDGKWYRLKSNGKPGVELTRNGNTMTESEFFGRIRSALRQATRFWVPAVRCIEKATKPYKGTDKRIKKVTQCASCKEWVARSKIQADHIIPCGSLRSYEDIAGFCERAFTEGEDNYQPLCKPCHILKTKEERK
jgi:5-methylcytosine-specific restriction endonuclease McrA